MALRSALIAFAVSLAVFVAVPGARAQPLLSLEASAGTAVTAPQSDRFGVGASATASGYLRVAPWLLPGLRVRAGFLSDGDAPVDTTLRDPGVGTFETFSAMLRLRPLASAEQQSSAEGLFVEGGGGVAITGELVRPAVEAGIGYGFALLSVHVAPTVRYLQLIQPSDPLSDEDARVVSLGAEFALLDTRVAKASAPAPEPPKNVPARDRDGDGLLDEDDSCPTESEDRDGHVDTDGCPDADNDGDKVLDKADACPDSAEDIDAFDDADGCPEPDNDGDTFLDADDQCPNEAEVVNGNQDYDGCPDEGVIELKNDRIVLEERVLFDFERARVRSAAKGVLAAIVRLYKQHPEWMKIRIEGHADSRGDEAFNQELSKRRAENVRKELVKLGIPAGMIESEGFGSSRPRDKRAEEDAYHRNRRVEFVVVARNPAGADAAAPAAPASAEPAPAETAPAAPAPAEPAPAPAPAAPADAQEGAP